MYVRRIKKIPEFYMIFARKKYIFSRAPCPSPAPMFFFGGFLHNAVVVGAVLGLRISHCSVVEWRVVLASYWPVLGDDGQRRYIIARCTRV